MLVSTRRGVLYPNTNRSDTADVPRDIAAVVAALEVDVIYGQGTLAARPTSTPGSPGIVGRVYFATDQSPMTLYWDYGTGWQSIGALSAGSVGATQIVDGCITGGPAGAGVKIAAATITHDNIVVGTIRGGGNEIAAGSITAADIAAALKPSGGAGAATEALRALGTVAGTAAAGNDARLSDARTPLAGSVSFASLAESAIITRAFWNLSGVISDPGAASGVFADYGSPANCQITIVEAGTYMVFFGAKGNGNASASTSATGCAINGAVVSEADYNNGDGTNSVNMFVSAFNAGDVLKLMHKDNDSSRQIPSLNRFIAGVKVVAQ